MNLADMLSIPARNVPMPRGATDPRERDARAAWYCLPPRLKVELADEAGVPAAADKPFSFLTPEERAAMRERAAMLPEGFRWGIEQL